MQNSTIIKLVSRLNKLQVKDPPRLTKSIHLNEKESIEALRRSSLPVKVEKRSTGTKVKKQRKKKMKPIQKIIRFPNFSVFLNGITFKTTDLIQFIGLSSDSEREQFFEENPELRENYNKVTDRFLRNSKKIQLEERITDLQTTAFQTLYSIFSEEQKQAFDIAVSDINLFRESSHKTSKIRQNYIVATKIMETLSNQLNLRLIELFELGKSHLENKPTSEQQLLYYTIDEQIDLIKQIRKDIDSETKNIQHGISEAKNKLEQFKNDQYNNKISCKQPVSGYVNKKWSELSAEDKQDRVESMVHQLLFVQLWAAIQEKCGKEFTQTYVLPQEHLDKMEELKQTFIDPLAKGVISKEIKWTQIKWKKHLGILTNLVTNVEIKLNNSQLEWFLKDLPLKPYKFQTSTYKKYTRYHRR